MATSPPTGQRSGLLRRVLRSSAGNTLVITGAAMLPMAAIAGSAVDMSRLYLVKVRLQQACDAGVLAGRRFMSGTEFDANASTQANAFFNFNFPDGAYGSSARTFTPQRTPSNQVQATASVSVPMLVMHMFGKGPVALNVACEAKYEIANTDVMFVLDVTGSMACGEATTAAQCTAYSNGISANLTNGRWQMPQATSSRLMALRTAIKGFYDTLDGAISNDARLRFGFVPYASSVNVGGRIREMSASHFADFYDYQSRIREHDGTWQAATRTNGNYGRVAGSEGAWGAFGSSETMVTRDVACPPPIATTQTGSGSAGNPHSPSVDANYVRTFSEPESRTNTETDYRRQSWTRTSGTGSTATGNCIFQKRTRTFRESRTNTLTQQPNWRWRYDSVRLDTTAFLAGNAVTTRTGSIVGANNAGTTAGDSAAQKAQSQGVAVSSTWSGCIQERRTIAGASISVGDTDADDLDIDLIPSSYETRWKPSWPEVTFNRERAAGISIYNQGPTDIRNTGSYFQPQGANTKFSCPKAAQRLAEMTRTQIDAYVDANDFAPHGGTYHDIGLVWGARLLSPAGIFGADNAVAPNGNPTQRHIIFMTDGAMAPNTDTYGSYGIEEMEGRVGVAGVSSAAAVTELTRRHNHRFLSLCEAIKDREITLWVVAYGQEMTTELSRCATPGKAFEATNSAQLKTQFEQIASQIAELRLDK